MKAPRARTWADLHSDDSNSRGSGGFTFPLPVDEDSSKGAQLRAEESRSLGGSLPGKFGAWGGLSSQPLEEHADEHADEPATSPRQQVQSWDDDPLPEPDYFEEPWREETPVLRTPSPTDRDDHFGAPEHPCFARSARVLNARPPCMPFPGMDEETRMESGHHEFAAGSEAGPVWQGPGFLGGPWEQQPLFAPIFAPVFVPKDGPTRARPKTRPGREKKETNVHTPAVKNKKATKRVPGPGPKARSQASRSEARSEASEAREQPPPEEEETGTEALDTGVTPAKLDAAKRQRPPDDPEELQRKKKAAKVEFLDRHLCRSEPRDEPLAGTDDDWERRKEKRKRQVDLGKNTLGYQNYVATVPPDNRDENAPPTPNHTTRDLSRKDFEAHLNVWRTFLHKYDDVDAEAPGGAGAAEDVAMDEDRSA